MQTWDLTSLDVKPRQPEVIDSDAEGRAIVIQLPAGEMLGEHQVHERAAADRRLGEDRGRGLRWHQRRRRSRA